MQQKESDFRTAPTIKPLTSFGISQRFEIRLATPHLIVLLGLVCGSIVTSYYLGVMAGQEAGFVSGRALSHGSLPRMLAKRTTVEENGNEGEFLARLSEPVKVAKDLKQELPEVTTIPNLKDVPILTKDTKDSAFDISNDAVKVKSNDTTKKSVAAAAIKESPKEKPAAKEKLESKSSEKVVVQKNPAPSKLSSGWYAQVAAPSVLKDAETLQLKLKNSGFPSRIEKAIVRDKEYYRVVVGPEQNKEHAQRMLTQLKRESYIKGEPFIKSVR